MKRRTKQTSHYIEAVMQYGQLKTELTLLMYKLRLMKRPLTTRGRVSILERLGRMRGVVDVLTTLILTIPAEQDVQETSLTE